MNIICPWILPKFMEQDLLKKLIAARYFNYPPLLSYFKPEVSLPCSQGPASGPYPEPDESDPHLNITIL
jgi:hypothetical protein